MEKTLKEFASVLPEWYNRSTQNEYYRGWIELLDHLPLKAERCGYFDMDDLSVIADWGGNVRGVKQRLQSNNTPEQVRIQTSKAIKHIDSPSRAIDAIIDLSQWGLSYGSKTLTFMNPTKYAILDSWIRRSLKQVLPSIRDGDRNSMINGYEAYLHVCSYLQRNVSVPFLETQDQWRLADIGQALFEFARSDGVLVINQNEGQHMTPEDPTKHKVALRTNNIIAKMRKGEIAFGCQFNSPAAEQVELLGIAGYDYVIFDGEHGSFTLSDLEEQSRVAQMCGLTPVGMAPDVELPTIHSFLERGIMGIHAPNITTEEDAQKLAEGCRYAPEGRRSLSFSRAAHFGFGPPRPEYMAHANSQIVVMALIEHVDALDHLDGILSVDGIDFYGIGPKDLAQSMGLPGQMEHPRVKEFTKQVTDAVHAVGKKMSHEVVAAHRASHFFMEAAVAFRESRLGQA